MLKTIIGFIIKIGLTAVIGVHSCEYSVWQNILLILVLYGMVSLVVNVFLEGGIVGGLVFLFALIAISDLVEIYLPETLNWITYIVFGVTYIASIVFDIQKISELVRGY